MAKNSEDDTFIKLPDKILERKDLKPLDKMIYCLIMSYEDSNKVFYASNKYISKRLGSAVRTIQASIKRLSSLGLICIKNPDSTKRSVQILHDSRAESASQPCENDTVTMRNRHTIIKDITQNIKQEIKTAKLTVEQARDTLSTGESVHESTVSDTVREQLTTEYGYASDFKGYIHPHLPF